MNLFSTLYQEVLFRPLFNLLVGLTDILPGHNVGVSIILVTIIVRIILLPASIHQAKSASKNQEKMAELRVELEAIKKKHKDDQAKQAEETLALYRKAGINPAAGCLPLLIQLPILIALYRVFLIGLGEETYNNLYFFVSEPHTIQASFLGIGLAEPYFILALIAGVFQFILMRMMPQQQTATTQDNSAQMMMSMQRNMAYMFPVMTVFIAMRLPAALALYWVATTLFAIVQQYALKRVLKLNSGNVPL